MSADSVERKPSAAASSMGYLARKCDQYANWIDEIFADKFYLQGVMVGKRPYLTMLIVVVVTILFAMGFTNIKNENRADQLWVPQGTTALADSRTYGKFFENSRVEFVIAEPKEGNNILTKSNMQEVMHLYQGIANISVNVNGDTESLSTLCEKDYSNGDPCLILSVLENWLYTPTILDAEADDSSVLATLNAANSPDYYSSYLGGMRLSEDQQSVVSAESVKLTFFIENNRKVVDGDYVDEEGEAWEEAYLKYLRKPGQSQNFPNLKVFPSATRSISDEFGGAIGADVQLIVYAYIILFVYVAINLGAFDKYFVNTRLALSFGVLMTVILSIVAAYGLSAGMGFIFTPLHSVLPFVLLGIGVDDSFVITDAFDTRQAASASSMPFRAATALSHAGVSITITSVTDFVAFAISSTSSLPALSSFCVYAAVGVVFLFLYQVTFYTAAVVLDGNRQNGDYIDIFCCFVSCGSSTSATEVIPIGESTEDSNKRTLQKSADYAAIENGKERSSDSSGDKNVTVPPESIPLDNGNSNELDKGVAVLGADISNTAHNHHGHQMLEEHNGANALNKFLRETYGPILMNPYIKGVVIVAFIIFSIFMIIGMTQLNVESSNRSFIPAGSYLLDTLDANDKYFGESGVRVEIVTHSYDHFERQDVLGTMQQELAGLEKKSPYIKDPYGPTYESWYSSYLLYINNTATTVVVDNDGRPTVRSEFYDSLLEFLSSSGGAKYNTSIVFNEDRDDILASKIKVEYEPFNEYINGRLQLNARKATDAMDDLRKICNNFKGAPVFPWTFEYTTWESFKILERELYQGLGLSLMAVFLLVLFLIGSPITSCLIALCVVNTLIGVLGIMYYWGLVIDNVSVINLILAVGLAVDYSAHVGHTFMLTPGSPSERVNSTLGSIGAAVLNGAMSTFLAVLLLSQSKSYVFQVLFRQFFSTVILGIGHGIILLPVMLSLLAPAPFSRAENGHQMSIKQKEDFQGEEAKTDNENANLTEMGKVKDEEGGGADGGVEMTPGYKDQKIDMVEVSQTEEDIAPVSGASEEVV